MTRLRALYYLACLIGLAFLLGGCWPAPVSSVGSPALQPREQLAAKLLATIPAGATLSTQPKLLRLLDPTSRPYIFPATGDAEYILLDVTAEQDPLIMEGVHRKVEELLSKGEFGVKYGQDGLLLLQRGLSRAEYPREFYEFLLARPGQEAFPLRVDFGDALELVGYDYTLSDGVLGSLTTYWRAVRPLSEDYHMVFLLSDGSGHSTVYQDGTLSYLWYPTSRWRSGEVVMVSVPVAGKQVRLVDLGVLAGNGSDSLPLAVSLRGKQPTGREGFIRLLDLSQPPTAKVPLSGFIGLPFVTPTAAPPPPGETPTASPSTSICGKPVEDPVQARLRPVAIKIDNAPAARPQTGLSQACIIYEHMAEGGITRFTAIYQSEDVEVGPVRSARRVDLHIVPPFKALLAHVGAAQAVMSAIRTYQLPDVDQFFVPGAYYYSRYRRAPHNVYTTVSRVRRYGEQLGYSKETDVERFPFLEGPATGGTPATDILIPYPYPSRAEFRYDAKTGTYLRFTNGQPHLDAKDGKQVRASTIIVQRVPSWIVSYTEDARGAPSLDFNLIGEGRVTIFHSGRRYDGTWKRASLEAMTRFYDQAGKPIPLAPGTIWISLVSPDVSITAR
jgi:hypothetical protein